MADSTAAPNNSVNLKSYSTEGEEFRTSHSFPRAGPVEVLELIIFYACSLNTVSSYTLKLVQDGDAWARAPAVVLSGVSFYWRTVILSSSSLWASYFVDIAGTTTSGLELVKLYVQRSKDRVLERVAIMESNRSDINMGMAYNILGTLVETLDRAKEIELRLSKVPIPTRFQSPTFPNLQRLIDHIDHDRFAETSPLGKWWHCLLSSPRLHDVQITIISLFFVRHIDASNLTHFTVLEADGQSLLRVLRCCSSLKHLVVGILDDETINKDTEPMLSIWSLVSIDIGTKYAPLDNLIPFFTVLHAPSLKSLAITSKYDIAIESLQDESNEDESNGDPGAGTWPQVVREFLRKSRCALTELSLDIPYPPDLPMVAILDLIESCTTLHSLSFKLNDVFPREEIGFVQLIQRLNTKPNPTAILPWLQSLVIAETIFQVSDETIALVQDLINARYHKVVPGGQLHQLEISVRSFDGREDEDLDEQLERLRDMCFPNGGHNVCVIGRFEPEDLLEGAHN